MSMNSPIHADSSSLPSHLSLQGPLEYQSKWIARPVEYLGQKAVTLGEYTASQPDVTERDERHLGTAV
jgi:hypothetical protein